MCIICNMKDVDGVWVAEAYLGHYSQAAQAMRKATADMLNVSKIASTPEQRKRYDRTHKKMARLLRQWNQIEHEREKGE